jgi:hypothetical protein
VTTEGDHVSSTIDRTHSPETPGDRGAGPGPAGEPARSVPDRLEAIADAARQLAECETVEAVAELGCRLATRLVPGARQAGVVRLMRGGHSSTVAADPEPSGALCAGGDDWVALPLECASDALVLYLDAGRPLDAATRRLASLLAGELGIALQATRNNLRADNLERALQTSRDIGVAMGIIMARRACTRAEAFDLLRRASRTGQRKLAGIAADVAEVGILEFELGSRDRSTGRLV